MDSDSSQAVERAQNGGNVSSDVVVNGAHRRDNIAREVGAYGEQVSPTFFAFLAHVLPVLFRRVKPVSASSPSTSYLLMRPWASYTAASAVLRLPLRAEREGRKTQLGDAALKYFLRSFTDGRKTHHSDTFKWQVPSPWQADCRETHFREGEGKLTQSKKLDVGPGNIPTKWCVQYDNVKEEGAAYRFQGFFPRRPGWYSSSQGIAMKATDTDTNEECGTETSEKVKVITRESEAFAEVHSVRVKRTLTGKFLVHLQKKIDILYSAAAPVIHVKSLLRKRAFLSASPEKLVAVIEVLTEFFESKSIAFHVLEANAGILEQPLAMSKQRMHVFSQFEVGRRACIKIGTTGICGPTLLKLLEARPSIVRSSVHKDLEVRLKLFQDWGFSANEVIRSLQQVPQHNIEHIESQFKLLRDQGLSHENASSIIRRQPSVLASTTKDLKAKLDFLCQVNRYISEVFKYPRYFAFSLEYRIIPRLRVLEAVSLSKKPFLSAMLASRASIFKKRFNIPEFMECI
ncbi:hypothetical protein GOP47_0022764 [Adiantum capillus-veneris]|uniref:Uncharacterized protein n=1 Tax=Adiantum capillus-veneris TaxID=13818 RepID=A0A9D4U6G1_ADICA|nr:hypothetical protein GOP47_0022764 [Adiantum capillus-veneris]